jgi:replication-associated recombination protein RarA
METIGREKEIKSIKSALRRKANVLLIGQRGVGKSHLLEHIAEEMKANCYYIPILQPAKSALTQAIAEIMDLNADELKDMKISRMTVAQLADMLIEVIKDKDDLSACNGGSRDRKVCTSDNHSNRAKPQAGFVLIIDALDKITATNSEWLTRMAEEITILGAIVEPKDTQHLKRFFWTFEIMEIKPLSDKDIKQLVMLAIKDYNIQFADKSAMKLFLGKVISNSKGIPLAAMQLCQKASNHTRKVSVNFIREHLRDHGASVKFIDATYLFIGLFGVIMAMRYISRGMGSMDAYTFWGAMSGILLVVRLLMFRSMKR